MIFAGTMMISKISNFAFILLFCSTMIFPSRFITPAKGDGDWFQLMRGIVDWIIPKDLCNQWVVLDLLIHLHCFIFIASNFPLHASSSPSSFSSLHWANSPLFFSLVYSSFSSLGMAHNFANSICLCCFLRWVQASSLTQISSFLICFKAASFSAVQFYTHMLPSCWPEFAPSSSCSPPVFCLLVLPS